MARTGYGKHSTQVDTNQYPDDPSVPIGSDEWNAEPSDSGMLGFTSETISSASSITPSNTVINISGSTNVSTISQGNTNEYDLLYVFTSGTVTLEHGTGNIQLLGGSNKDLSSTVPTILMRKGSSWYEYGGSGTVEMGGTMTSHIIPDTNDTYDIGSAEYKIRDMYVADNSLWVGDDHKVEVQNGKMKFKKRKKNTTPTSIENAGGNSEGALASSGRASLDQMTLHDWVVYGKSLGGSLANAKPNDIFTSDNADDWESDDSAGGASSGILIPHSTTSSDYTDATETNYVYIGSYATETVTSDVSNYSNVANGYDGDLSTYSETTSSPWLQDETNGGNVPVTEGGYTIDYGKVLYGVGIQSKVSNMHNGFGTGIGIRYSTDGSTWTNIYYQTDNNIKTWIDTGTHNLTNVNVRYLQIVRLGNNGWNKVRIYELKVTNMTANDVESITSDFGADKLVCGIELKVGEIDDSSLTISTSDDNTNWTVNRTILTSKLTQNTSNFIRMNPTSCRYVKVVGTTPSNISRSSGSFAQLPEADGLIKPDSYVLANHEHSTISTTDTTLGLDGT